MQLLSTTAHTAALLKDPHVTDHAVNAVDTLGPDTIKARAVVLAEATYTLALTGDLDLCLHYGGTASKLAHDLDASIAIDLLFAVIQLVLPFSAARAVREQLLPQLATLKCESQPETSEPDNTRATET